MLPGDAWCRDFVEELDREYRRVAKAGGPGRATLWYWGQLVSPATVRFVWMMRRRGGAMGGRGAGGWRTGWLQDLRHAARGLTRDARLAGFVVVTLALGIGGTGAMFGVVDRLFLRGPAHVAEPDDLVRLYLRFEGSQPRTTPWIPYRTAEAFRIDARGFAGVALHSAREMLARVDGTASPLRVGTVGRGFFDLLGTAPARGRFIGGSGDPASYDVAVVSQELASRLAPEGGVLGRTVELPERRYRVVGVAPPGFTGPGLEPVDVWVPLTPDEAGSRNWNVVARVRGAGADPEQVLPAVAEANRVHASTDPGRFFQWAREGRVIAAPIGSDDGAGEAEEVTVARLLTAVAVVVLVIGMANVVNLLLARLTRRRRELAVRMALGGGRWRMARLLVSESLVLATLGGLAALPVAWCGGWLVRRVLLSHVAWPASPLQGRVLALTFVVVGVVGVLLGIVPAWRANRTDVAAGLRAGSRGGGGRRARLHVGLAAAQVALSAVLLAGAGLFLKSFRTLRVTDLGVDAESVVAVSLSSLDAEAIPPATAREYELYLRALDAVAGDPDVAAASVSLGLPFLYNFGLSIVVPGRDSIPNLPGGGPWLTAVTEDYFETVGTTILRGRDFTAAEVAGDEPVLMVSQSMARLLWPGVDALGACVRVGDGESPCSRVVGVVEDVHRQGYREPPSLQYYVPLAPGGSFGGMTLTLRLRDESGGALARIRSTLVALDPAVDWVETTRLASALEPQIRPWRLGSWVLGTAALLALAVAVVGVYGVLSYLVEQRRREIGIRIALGASMVGIRGLVLRTGLGATAAGLSAGLAAVVLSARWLEPLLVETRAGDPLVLGGVAGILLAAGVAACLLPAGRAAGVEPSSCLKEE